MEKSIIEVGAATLDRKIANFAKQNGIGKMEFLSCIPGSLGGAITMNSGCYGSDISNILHSIKVLDEKGEEKEINNDEIKFFYREPIFQKLYNSIQSSKVLQHLNKKLKINKINS